VPRACRRVQTDLDRRRFGHGKSPSAQSYALVECLSLPFSQGTSRVNRETLQKLKGWMPAAQVFVSV
jgi:hypothetical protein